jgi:small-conductance mechanosensitive channel
MIWALIQASPADHPIRVFGVTLVGLNGQTLSKVLMTLILVTGLILVAAGARMLLRGILRGPGHERGYFWGRQAIRLIAAAALIIGLISIWFEDPTRLATFAGLISAGVAIALQRVITSFAAYLIILRGRIFNVGDRITIGGVRGDVVALDFMQTTVMEMGQTPAEQGDSPSMWVHGRQYSGRLVRITNDKIFDTPVYNFTRAFPFMWEEMHLPISFSADRKKAEAILLDVARRHTREIVEQARPGFESLRQQFRAIRESSIEPRIFMRLTDNWVELSVRFLVEPDRVRDRKDAMSRDLLAGLEAAGIGIASTTFEIVGLPTLHVVRDGAAQPRA